MQLRRVTRSFCSACCTRREVQQLWCEGCAGFEGVRIEPALRITAHRSQFVSYGTYFQIAITQGLPFNATIIKQLLSIKDSQGCTPLHLAILNGQLG